MGVQHKLTVAGDVQRNASTEKPGVEMTMK
jgi:hypothetical protein